MRDSFRNVQETLAPGSFQFVLAVLFAVAGFLWEPLGLPRADLLTEVARDFFEEYGLPALFVAAFIESLFMVSVYFPGSFVVVLAILVSDRSPASLGVIVGIGWVSVLCATAVNYWLGREGFYRLLLCLGSKGVIDTMQGWLATRGRLALFLAGVHPNILAIANVCLGITHAGIHKSLLLSFASIAFWIPVQVFLLGFVLPNPLDNAEALYGIAVVVLLVWGVALVVKEQQKKQKEVAS